MDPSEYLYVLVFNNPYPKSNANLHSKFLKKLPIESAEASFKNCFKLSANDPNYENALRNLKASLTGKSDYKQAKLSQKIFELLICVLQKNLGIEIKHSLSGDKSEIYISLRVSDENLKVQAQIMKYRVPLKFENGKFSFQQVPPYGDYVIEAQKKSLYDEVDGKMFKYIDRVRILNSMLTNVLEMTQLEDIGLLETEFPLHTHDLQILSQNWIQWFRFWKPQNIDAIKDYYGEKIAMYFAWLEFYISWLAIPAFFGTVCGILEYSSASDRFDIKFMTLGEWSLLIFALLLSISSTLMDQLWVRKQSVIAWKWGVSDYYKIEEQRSGYKGDYKHDHISGTIKKISSNSQTPRQAAGHIVACIFVTMVIICVVELMIYKSQLHFLKQNSIAEFIGIANAIQIKIFNFIYRHVARFLTNWENYETQTQYINSLIVKLFTFQFINSYISLFYIAFVKRHYEKCLDDDCLKELTLQLGSIYMTNLFLNIIELGLPFIKSRIRMRKLQNTFVAPEQMQKSYESYDEPLDDYMEIVIGYGYVVLFGVAFPFTPLMALFLCIVELRVDAWKLCNLTRRPFPSKDGSIGIWLKVTQAMAVAGVITNVGVIIFTTDVFDSASSQQQWITFFIIEHALLLFKISLSAIIPDKPSHVEDGLKWSSRVANEKIYERYVDANQERKLKGLVFKTPQTQSVIKVDEILI